MKNKKPIKLYAVMFPIVFLLSACTPEVGSPEWCEMMEEKDKGDWTVNEGKDYLKHCVLKKDKKD